MAKKRENMIVPVTAVKLVQVAPHVFHILLKKAGTVAKTNPADLEVSDRAYRYRAQKNAPPRSRCYWCGRAKQANGKPLEIAHIDGHEENTDAHNLGWTCKSCNLRCANTLKNAGIGRRIRQANRGSSRAKYDGGAQTLGAWINAVLSMKGDPGGDMKAADAIRLIHETPARRRSQFAHEIWEKRGVVPF